MGVQHLNPLCNLAGDDPVWLEGKMGHVACRLWFYCKWPLQRPLVLTGSKNGWFHVARITYVYRCTMVYPILG